MRAVPSFLVLAAAAFAFVALPAGAAQSAGDFRPKADTYICPNSSGSAVDCFLDAVDHLYTMCRQVKSIEILEFGYEQSEQGVNGAKSEYCVDKHKGSMARPYLAALKEASNSRAAMEAIRGLHEVWLRALVDLKWQPPETDDDYKGRVGLAYDAFHDRAQGIRTAISETPAPKPPASAKGRATAKAAH